MAPQTCKNLSKTPRGLLPKKPFGKLNKIRFFDRISDIGPSTEHTLIT